GCGVGGNFGGQPPRRPRLLATQVPALGGHIFRCHQLLKGTELFISEPYLGWNRADLADCRWSSYGVKIGSRQGIWPIMVPAPLVLLTVKEARGNVEEIEKIKKRGKINLSPYLSKLTI
ncbi:MAG: hypothetical protein WCP58_07330, partial [bacterium]